MAIISGGDGPSNMWMRPSWRQGVFRSPRHRSPTSNNAALALEAGTLPRSTRFKWRAGTQHLPVHQPSGADGILTRSTRRWQWPLGCKKRLRYASFFVSLQILVRLQLLAIFCTEATRKRFGADCKNFLHRRLALANFLRGCINGKPHCLQPYSRLLWARPVLQCLPVPVYGLLCVIRTVFSRFG